MSCRPYYETMNLVEKEAISFSNQFFRSGDINNLEKLQSKLSDKLYNFLREKDKLFFLSVLRKQVEKQKVEHEKKCNKPNCGYSEEREIGIFIIDQEIDDISKHYEYIPTQGDEFSVEEKVDLHNRINEIIERLETLGNGQEIIFNELDDLKEHFNLGKKNWFQLVKGKLFDLGIENLIAKPIIKEIYSSLIKGFEDISKMIDIF